MSADNHVINIQVVPELLDNIRDRLTTAKEKAPNVLKKALNLSAKNARTVLARQAKKTYAVKNVDFKSAIEHKKATKSNLVAILKVKGRAKLLTSFKYKPNVKKAAARARVLKKGRMKVFKKNGFKAFVVKLRNGKEVMAQRENGNKSFPIKVFHSLSVPGMIGSRERVYGVVKPKIEESLRKHIDKEIARLNGGS